MHATAVVVGESGLLIRGASGAGKSRLAALLLAEAERRGTFARLVGDDRVALCVVGRSLIARAHPALGGLIERRFDGLVPVAHEPACVVHGVIEFCDAAPPRLPEAADRRADLLGVEIARLVLPAGWSDIDAPSVLDRLARERTPRL